MKGKTMDLQRTHAPFVRRRESMQKFERLYARVSLLAGVAGAIAMVTIICRTSHLLG